MKNKKRLIIEAVSAVIIFVIGYFVGDASAISRVNSGIRNNVTKQSTSPQQTMSPKPAQSNNNTTSTQDNQSGSYTKTYKLGEEGAFGNWSIKVLGVDETNTVQGGNSSDNKTTTEKFIVVNLQMKNISKQPAQYSPRDFMLINMKDKSKYNIDDTAFNAMESANSKEKIYNKNSNFIGVYDDVNPNTTKQTYIVFEVPKDANIADYVFLNANGGSTAAGFSLK